MRQVGALPTSWPDHIAVIGGGRWARVLADMLCEVAPAHVSLSLHSRHNAIAVAHWRAATPAAARVALREDWDVVAASRGRPAAGVVANDIRHHAAAAEHLLNAGIPALVEKPMATTAPALARLESLAARSTTRLAAAHIFRFAGNIAHFAALVRRHGAIQALGVEWSDPPAEVRYGAAKRYDAGVPVYADWLPHVLSVIRTLLPGVPDDVRDLEIDAGGAGVRFRLNWAGVPCDVRLRRNDDRRRRVVVAEGDAASLRLDFSNEPGTVSRAGDGSLVRVEWPATSRASVRMLTAFAHYAAGGDMDAGLDLDIARAACRLSDELTPGYTKAVVAAVVDHLATGAAPGDVQYALTELLQYDRRLPSAELDGQIARLRQAFAGRADSDVVRVLMTSELPGAMLRALAAESVT